MQLYKKINAVLIIFCYCIFLNTKVFGKRISFKEAVDRSLGEYRNRALAKDEVGIVLPFEVTFTLWTSLQESTIIKVWDLEEVKFSARRLKFIIHGYKSSGKADWVRKIREKYLGKGIYNVIEVDWEDLAKSWSYPEVSGYTKGVGYYLAYLIEALYKTQKIQLSAIHIIGHSLGAHAAGFAGKHVYNMTQQKIGRISGLDPAGPLFIVAKDSERLNREDAIFVDVIHTDGKRYGLLEPLGDVDYYPNGGFGLQPGCQTYIDDILTCSHSKVQQFWEESITSAKFVAYKCRNFKDYAAGRCRSQYSIVMGEMIYKFSPGKYYLSTNAESPYAKN